MTTPARNGQTGGRQAIHAPRVVPREARPAPRERRANGDPENPARSRATGCGAPSRASAVLGAVDGLALAASPTFALMAWIAASEAPATALCASGSGILPVDGMTAMYLLMSLFHLPPWLRLPSGRPWART